MGIIPKVSIKKEIIMKCEKCNTENRDDANFCKGCGEKITYFLEENISDKTDLFLLFALVTWFIVKIIPPDLFPREWRNFYFLLVAIFNTASFFLLALSIKKYVLRILAFIVVCLMTVPSFINFIIN